MANKEATIYVIDVGESMGRKENGRSQSNLDWSMQYVWDKITTTVKDGKKTQQLGVLLVRSDRSENMLDPDEYANIHELQEIKQTLLPDLRALRESIVPSETEDGDVVSALVVAISMMEKHTRTLKYTRRIILVTDGTSPIDGDDTSAIAKKIKADGIELTVLGVDFDDADFGVKEEDKSEVKAKNERILRELCEECEGNYGTMEQAVSELGIPRITQPNPVPSYRGFLTLGDPQKYETALSIAVERYPKVRIAKAPTASSFAVRTGGSGSASTQPSATLQNGSQGDDGLTGIKQSRTYTVEDDKAPGGKRELDREDLARGYEYGRTAVPMEREDEHVTKLETYTSFDLIGFVHASEYEHWMSMTETNQIVPAKANEKAAMALSSLIHALFERECYAVARLVPRDNKEPVLVLLAPFFQPEENYECLIDVELPFAEDVRSFNFPPLDKVVTVAGKHILTHRNLPSEKLLDAMSNYVDAMDLSKFDRDEDGKPAEYAAIPDTFNVRKNYMEQAIKFRAINPIDEVPPPYEILSKYSKPPRELVEQAQAQLDAVIKVADVKKVPPKQKGRKRGRDAEKPISNLDVDALLAGEKRVKISADNAIPEFKQWVSTTENSSDFGDAVQQLSAIIQEYIRTSTGNVAYNRAIEALRVMKEEMVELEEPDLYNTALKEIKKKIIAKELGGDRSEMWYYIKVNRLGLIDSNQSGPSKVTPDEAKSFLRAE